MAFKCNYFLIENRVGTVDLCKEEKKTIAISSQKSKIHNSRGKLRNISYLGIHDYHPYFGNTVSCFQDINFPCFV